jgi:competence protein ComEA
MWRRLFVFLCLLVPVTALAGVDINAASQSELERLPGIGPSKAAAIVEYRGSHGGFKSVDELDNVPGIGPSTMANLRPLVEVGAAPAGGSTAKSAPPPAESEAPPATAGSAGAAGRININTATAAELQKLPGIGPSKAANILADREQRGLFSSCSDIGRVSGIGPATVSAVADLCTIGN